jgi:hypothetical protein
MTPRERETGTGQKGSQRVYGKGPGTSDRQRRLDRTRDLQRGIGGDPADNSAMDAGAAYVLTRSGATAVHRRRRRVRPGAGLAPA